MSIIRIHNAVDQRMIEIIAVMSTNMQISDNYSVFTSHYSVSQVNSRIRDVMTSFTNNPIVYNIREEGSVLTIDPAQIADAIQTPVDIQPVAENVAEINIEPEHDDDDEHDDNDGLWEVTTNQMTDLSRYNGLGSITKDQINSVINSNYEASQSLLNSRMSAYKNALQVLANKEREIVKIKQSFNTIKGNAQKLFNQIEDIKNDPLIDCISIYQSNIIFKTKEIITDNLYHNRRRKIGKMLISIPISLVYPITNIENIESQIKIYNMSFCLKPMNGVGNEFQCPHVHYDGMVCFGHRGYDLILKALESSDLHTAFDIIISFLKNPNENDAWGQCVYSLPAVD